MDFVAQSLASGTVDDREKQISKSLIVIALLETQKREKTNTVEKKTSGLKLTIKKTT